MGLTSGTRWISSRSSEIFEIMSNAAIPVLSLVIIWVSYSGNNVQAESGGLVQLIKVIYRPP